MIKSIYDTNKYMYLMITLDAILFKRLPRIKIKTDQSPYITYKSFY